MTPAVFLSKEPSPNYRNALIRCGFSVADDMKSADGLVLTGGGDVAPCVYGNVEVSSKNVDIVRDNYELYLIKRFLYDDKPILGICRGLQILNVYFGGTLAQDIPRHSGEKDVTVKCDFFGVFEKLYGKSGNVLCNHHQSVDRLGKGLLVAALSKDKCVEAVSGKKIIATQFHPERMTDGFPLCGYKVFFAFKKLF